MHSTPALFQEGQGIINIEETLIVFFFRVWCELRKISQIYFSIEYEKIQLEEGKGRFVVNRKRFRCKCRNIKFQSH